METKIEKTIDIETIEKLLNNSTKKSLDLATIEKKLFELHNDFNKINIKHLHDDHSYYIDQDIILLSYLYSLSSDYGVNKELKFTETTQITGDWIFIRKDKQIFLILNSNHKRNNTELINLTKNFNLLSSILYTSYITYPRSFVWTNKSSYPNINIPTNINTLNKRLEHIFPEYKSTTIIDIMKLKYKKI